MDVNEARVVYHDTRNTSPDWHQRNRMVHPLTEHQFGNNFRVGDRVTMQIVDPIRTRYISAIIVAITSYDTAQAVLGPYNRDSTSDGAPFTRAIVLDSV